MGNDRNLSWMNETSVCLPDSYSAEGNHIFDGIQSLSRESDLVDRFWNPLTTARGSLSAFQEEEYRHQPPKTPNLRRNPISAPDTLLRPVGNIFFDDSGEVVSPIPPQANADSRTRGLEMPDFPQVLTQSYEPPQNADLFSNQSFEPTSGFGSSTGTMIYGDDARNAKLQAKEYVELFDAAERSTPQTINPGSINWTYPFRGQPQEWIIPKVDPARALAYAMPSIAYQSSPFYGLWSTRSAHAAGPDPIYFRLPTPGVGPQLMTSFDNQNIGALPITSTNATSMNCAASWSTVAVAPPTVTTLSATLIGDAPECSFLGCHHKLSQNSSNRTRHLRGHTQKFRCRVGNCRQIVGRSDNRRTHLESRHKSIPLPPKTKNARKRKEAGGIDEALNRYFFKFTV